MHGSNNGKENNFIDNMAIRDDDNDHNNNGNDISNVEEIKR